MGVLVVCPVDQRLSTWHLVALLLFAIFAPVDLPTVPPVRRQLQVRRRHAGQPLLNVNSIHLKSSPCRCAPRLAEVEIGQPMKVICQWRTANEHYWLRVKVGNRRGWIPV